MAAGTSIAHWLGLFRPAASEVFGVSSRRFDDLRLLELIPLPVPPS
jgi:hypothetical protein